MSHIAAQMTHCVGCGNLAKWITGHVHAPSYMSTKGTLSAGWCGNYTLPDGRIFPECSVKHTRPLPLDDKKCPGCAGSLKDIKKHWRTLGLKGLRR